MSQLLRKHANLVKLIFEVQNETADTRQQQELSDLLRSNAESQVLYLRLMGIHANLVLSSYPLITAPWEPRSRKKKRRKKTKKQTLRKKLTKTASKYLLPLMVLLFLGVASEVGFYLFRPASNSPQAPQISPPVVTVTDNYLQIGKLQELEKGNKEITLPTGVKVLISAPAKFIVTGENSIDLQQGKLVATVPKSGIGFRVNTPRGRVVDLGTIFGVEVDSSGISSVQVFKGNVELLNSSGIKTPLAAGSTMRSVAGKEEWQPSEKLSKEFYTVLEKHSSSILSSNFVSLNEPIGWLGGPDEVTAILYVMYSVTPLKERFATFENKQEEEWKYCTNHFAIVQFDETTQKWIFHANEVPEEFTPVSTDLILARTDFTKNDFDDKGTRQITFYQEEYGTLHGITYGYQASDIDIRPDWSLNPNGKEGRNLADYHLKGTYLIRKDESQ